MKKTICILLTLLLALTLLPATALAAGETAQASSRALRVDGKPAACEAYEIGGEVWFKLRDVALALSGTGSRFSVDWDGETRTVLLATGGSYIPDGSEGQPKEPGAAAVPGSQTIRIDGEIADLPAWNVGGNNFFRLADLALLLGFQADYDEASDTAIIRAAAHYERSGWIGRTYNDEISGAVMSCELTYDPTLWLVREEITETNDGRYSREVTAYGEDGRPLTVTTYGENSTTTITYRYDELGRETERVFDTLFADGTEMQTITVSEYDRWGQLVRQSANGGESVTTFTYDERGNQTALEQVMETPVGQWISGSYNEYDGAGNRTKAWTVQRGEVVEQWEFSYEDGGNVIREARYDGEGNLLMAMERAYEGERLMRMTQDYGTYAATTVYSYDDEAGTRTMVTESPAGSSRTVLWVDGENKPLRQEWTDGVRTSVTTYEYDEAGRLVRQASGDPEAPSAVNEISYDENGRVRSSVYKGSDYAGEDSFEYDPAEGKVTHSRRINYPTASEMKLLYESVTLPAGGSRGQMVFFLPANSMQEPVAWSTSDESVATVDERGIIIAVSPGTATITGTSESGLTAECTVTVTE